MELRNYQSECLLAIKSKLLNANKTIVCASVGSGKTIIMSKISELSKANVLIVVPRVSLIEQTVNKVKLYSNDVGIYCASLGKKELDKKIIVSTIQSIKKCSLEFRIVMVDECHLFTDAYQKFLSTTKYKYAIGFTGTPENTFDFWGSPCYSLPIEKLTSMGFLTPLSMQSASSDCRIDLKNVKSNSMDYVLSSLYDEYRDLIDAQVRDALEKTADRKNILWMAVNIEHADLLGKMINAPVVHSNIKNSQEIIKEFSDGKHRHLISVAMISVGADFPIADALVLMRATKSRALFVQTVGRILRLHPEKKDALLLDYGRVVENLGHPYKIDFNSNIVPEKLKICDVCDEFNHQTAKTCSKCDSAFMSMCAICLSPKKYGEKCCVKKTPPKKTFNLTEYSYDPDRAYIVLSMSIHSYKAKSGNDCWKVTYVLDDFTSVTEYLKKEWQNREDIKKPKTLRTFINGKYRNVKSKSY